MCIRRDAAAEISDKGEMNEEVHGESFAGRAEKGRSSDSALLEGGTALDCDASVEVDAAAERPNKQSFEKQGGSGQAHRQNDHLAMKEDGDAGGGKSCQDATGARADREKVDAAGKEKSAVKALEGKAKTCAKKLIASPLRHAMPKDFKSYGQRQQRFIRCAVDVIRSSSCFMYSSSLLSFPPSCASVCLCVCLSACLSTSLLAHPPVCLFVRLIFSQSSYLCSCLFLSSPLKFFGSLYNPVQLILIPDSATVSTGPQETEMQDRG